MSDDQPQVSVVVPIYNEEASIEELFSRVVRTMEEYGRSFEFVAVDDGSTDRSFAILRQLRSTDGRLRVLRLTRNFGQTAALYAAFSRVRGQQVVMLDADLQNFPEDIPKLLGRLEDGFDVVSGWRTERHDGLFRKMASRLLNLWIDRNTKLGLHDYGCALKAFRRDVVDRMNTLTHRCRYLPTDMAFIGGTVSEVEVRHDRRHHGKSRYSIWKLMRITFDLLTTVTLFPLQLIGVAGCVLLLAGAVAGGWAAYVGLSGGPSPILQTIVACTMLFSGVQLVALGLMSEYLGRAHIESQRKPFFFIGEELE